MYFSGVHFNICDVFKVSVGKFFSENIQPTFQVSNRTPSNRTESHQVIDIPLSNVVPIPNDAQPECLDTSPCPEQRNITHPSIIITYDSSCQAYRGLEFKGRYVDCYV